MAISLTGIKQGIAKRASSKRIAKEYEKQQRRESKRKGWSGLLGGVGGKLLGAGLIGLTGVTGGLAAPLLMAAGSFGGKALAHEATKGMGAKTGKLKGDKYGFGSEEATTLREGLEEQLKASDPLKQRGAFGGELLGAYASAGLAGDLGGAKTLLKGGEGSLGEAITGAKDWEFGGLEGIKSGIGSLLDTSFTDEWGDPVEQKGIADSSADFVPAAGGGKYNPTTGEEITEEGWSLYGEQGGLVPDKAPSIVEYFSMQGKTLGGSNTQSLSQMLGRS